jgi:hypothetical protein
MDIKFNILVFYGSQSSYLIDRTIPNNKPGSIIRDNKQAACLVTDVALPGERNVVKKEIEKILKYKDNRSPVHVECESKSETDNNGATGTISKSRQFLSNIPGEHEIKELPKSSHIRHCTHTAECADVKARIILLVRNNS